jgi:hypothetical protein
LALHRPQFGLDQFALAETLKEQGDVNGRQRHKQAVPDG